MIEATRLDAQTAVDQARNIFDTVLKDLEDHGYEAQVEEPQDEAAEEKD